MLNILKFLETIRETKDLPDEAVLDAAITEFLNNPASNKNRGVRWQYLINDIKTKIASTKNTSQNY